MNQNYIQAVNFACIIYLIYLTLGISRDNNVLNNLKTKNEDSSDIVNTIKEVLKHLDGLSKEPRIKRNISIRLQNVQEVQTHGEAEETSQTYVEERCRD